MRQNIEFLDVPGWIMALLLGLLLAACNPSDAQSHKMPADLAKTPAKIEEQLAFTCAYEKDRIPERDPEADMLFEHANWRYKKNLLKEDEAVYPEAERLYRIATAWGHDKAANNLALMIMRGYTGSGDRITKPVDIAEDLIGRGIPHGYYLMGFMLTKGYGVKHDDKAALQYFRKAADLGDPEAQFFVGEKLESMTIKFPVSFAIGEAMKRCAADQGHAQAAIDTAIGLMNNAERTHKSDEKAKLYSEALKYLQIATKSGSPSGPSMLWNGFNGPPPDDGLYYMGQAKDEERVARYKAIGKVLHGYDYAGAKVPEIDEICPLPPAKLPPWDGEIEWVKKWKKNEAPPLPSEERIAEMALEKSLNPETGLPVKIDLQGVRLLDPKTGERMRLKLETEKLVNRLLRKMAAAASK